MTRFALLVALLVALPVAAASAAPGETQTAQIYYGEDADEGEYPYAAFVDSPAGSCTGTLVANNKVLTAAHCVESLLGVTLPPQVFTVGLGSRDLNDQDSYDVVEVDKHEDFDPDTLQNDLAMLTLDAAAPETTLRVIDTNETAQWEPGDILRIAGWGEMEDQNFPDILQEANVPRISDTACDDHYGAEFDSATMVCAGDGSEQSPEEEDTCRGDSGGPLMATDAGDALTLVGVTSWGEEECGTGPGVYARIGEDPLNDWVKDRLTGGPPPGPPPNDDFADAIGMSGNFDSVLREDNRNATKETDEPDHAGDAGGVSVWYTWTAPATGPTSVDTCDSNFDTLIGVYTGSGVGALSEVAGSDDDCNLGNGSFAGFTAQAGQTYHFAVDGFEGDTGNFDIYVELTPTASGGDGGGGNTTPPPPPPPATSASAGNDRLFGNSRNNLLCGLAGSDLIRGGAGNDTIFGDQCGARSRLSARAAAAGDGNDRLFGDAGNDRLFGSGRHDRLFGGSGNDRLFGGRGNDLLVGGRGRDSLSGGRGRDTINSRDGARDVVNCGPGRDTVRRDRRDRVRGCERVRR